MKKFAILTAAMSASMMLAGCNAAPKDEAPADDSAMDAAAPEAAPEMAPADAAAAAPAAEASDGSDDTETGGGGIKPIDSGN